MEFSSNQVKVGVKMIKKIFFSILVVCIVVCSAVSLSCCDNSAPSSSSNINNNNNTPSTNTSSTECAHLWGQWVIKENATCQTVGTKERSCHNCNKTESEKIKATEHKESDWIIDKVAEVGIEGLKYTKCIYCDKRIKEESIPAIIETHQHAVVHWVKIKVPTCTTSGKQYAICSCGKTIDSKDIPANGHSLVIDKAVAVTCTTNGLTEGSHCSICNAIIVRQETIKSKGHSVVVDKAVAVTCTTNGLTEGSHCSVCGTIFVQQQTVASKGHTMSSKRVAATYDKKEHTLHYCTSCSYSYEEFDNTASPIKFKSNNNGTCSVIGLSDLTIENLVIPTKSPDGDMVISIRDEAFKGNTKITSVVIPDSVTTIGSSAFESCSNLKSVIFPKNENENFKLNYRSFAFSGIENVDLSKTNMDSVARDAFYGCKKLKTVKLNNVKKIDNFAFSQCSELTSLIHSGELTTIGERSFENCKKLTVLKGKDSKHNLDTVLQFDRHSFYGSAIRDIVLNKNLKSDNYAFEGCLNLGTVDLSQVSSILPSFVGSKIERLVFPSSLTRIFSYCFSKATIGSLVLPDTVTEIGAGAFSGASIGKITFGSGLKTIQAEAFKNATATYDFSKVHQALSIGYGAFANNKFTSFSFPKSTISIGQGALMGCDNLQTLSIPFIANDSKSGSVSTDCFAWLFGESIDCWDQDTVVPKSLETVIIHGENPDVRDFMGVNITNLVVGKDITAIGSENFGSNSSLTSVFYEGTEQEWNKINLSSFMNNKLLTAKKYFYSDIRPSVAGNFWHYNANGFVEIW